MDEKETDAAGNLLVFRGRLQFHGIVIIVIVIP